MLDKKVFIVDTRAIAATLLLRISESGISDTLQATGHLFDATSDDIARIGACYYLARISNGKSMSMDAVYLQIHQFVSKTMTRYLPNMSFDQMERAKGIILKALTDVFVQQYGMRIDAWDNCTINALTKTEFTIHATRSVANASGIGSSDALRSSERNKRRANGV